MEVNATFEQIAQLLNNKNYTEFGPVLELQHLASEGNTIFTVIDKLGKRFTAEVYYNPETGELQPPLSQQIPYLIGLPLPVLMGVAVEMNLPDILRMCRYNEYLNQSICENDIFWKQKFIHDFGTEDIGEERQIDDMNYWKNRYINSGKIYSFGDNRYRQLGFEGATRIGLGIQSLNIPTQISNITTPIKSISAGRNHSLMIDLNNNVLVAGKDITLLGLKSKLMREKFKPINMLDIKAKAISAGTNHSLIIDMNDRVWSFGYNDSGQLGMGDEEKRSNPTLISTITIPIKAISASSVHSLLLDFNGNVYSFGNNGNGELGLGDTINRNTPTLIPNITTPIKSISAGAGYSLILDINDRIYSFGVGEGGRLGLGDEIDRYTPTAIPDLKAKHISAGFGRSLIVDTNNIVWKFGYGIGAINNIYKPTPIRNSGSGTGGYFKAKSISAGVGHCLLIGMDDKVYSFGNNTYGKLGLGDIKENVRRPTMISAPMGIKAIEVSAGYEHSLLISY